MPDDRPVEEPVDAIAALRAEFEDFKTTMAARMLRRPTGDIEMTFRASPKADTLFLQGQRISRVTYSALWQWVQDNGLNPSVFGNGDGSTTFDLPNFQGRVPRGATTTDIVGEVVGTDTLILTVSNMPQHTHTVGKVNDHKHLRPDNLGETNSTGSHWGHTSTGNVEYPYRTSSATGGGGTHGHPTSWGGWQEDHFHTVDPGDWAGGHDHTLTNTGNGTAFDNRPASIGVNYMIWT
jgi:microcystin-dependent protein